MVHCKLSFLDCSFGQKDSAVFFFDNFGDVFFVFCFLRMQFVCQC